MDDGLLIALRVVLVAVMFGLGMSLTVVDFTRIRRNPRPVVVALAVQVLLLPALAFGIALALRLPPILAVGLVLLAASPGGTTANLLSHLFRGDVALNITLTAVNSVLAVATLPLLVDAALTWFAPADLAGGVGLQFGKISQVLLLVLVPVLAGMALRAAAPGFCIRADPAVRLLSVVALIALVIGALVAEWQNIADYLASAGLAATLLCTLSLALGYAIPRLAGLGPAQAIATTFEVGIHNSTLAMTLAISVFGSVQLAVPAAVYSGVMYPLALVAGWLISRRLRGAPERGAPAPGRHPLSTQP